MFQLLEKSCFRSECQDAKCTELHKGFVFSSPKKSKKAAFDQDSDVEIFQSGFASETAPKPRTGRARKEVKYFAESDEDDDFDMFN